MERSKNMELDKRQVMSSLAAALVLACLGSARADEAARAFPEKKCKYVLPSKEWSWAQNPDPNAILMAVGPRGLIVTCAAMTLPAMAPLDSNFTAGFDKNYFKPGQQEKRNSSFITFQGIPCYEARGTMNTGQTTATRVFLAHGFGYVLVAIGEGQQPVEQDPDCEKIFAGFSFTTPPPANPPPVNPPPAPTERDNISYKMGQIVGYCLIAIIGIVLLRRLFGKS